MTRIDLFIFILLIIFIFKGSYNGLIKELFSLMGFVVGMVTAYIYFPVLSKYISGTSLKGADYIAYAISFVLIFLGGVIVFKIFAYIFTGLVKTIRLSWLNRVLGGCMGIIKGGILSLLLVTIILLAPFPSSFKEEIKNSYLGAFLVKISQNTISYIYPDILTKHGLKGIII